MTTKGTSDDHVLDFKLDTLGKLSAKGYTPSFWRLLKLKHARHKQQQTTFYNHPTKQSLTFMQNVKTRFSRVNKTVSFVYRLSTLPREVKHLSDIYDFYYVVQINDALRKHAYSNIYRKFHHQK